MATLIYNQNSFVRWDKDECDNYTITNIVDYSAVDVIIKDLTGDWTETFTLEIGGVNSTILPGDGIFQICAVAQELLPDNEYTLTNFTFEASIVNIGPLDALDKSKIMQVNMTAGGVIYQSTAYGGGDPDNSFVTPPTSYQTVLDTITTWLGANGGGQAWIVAPGTNPEAWMPIDPTNYQLIVIALGGDSLSQVITQQSEGIIPVYHSGDVDCLNTWQGVDTENGWILSLLFNGEEVLTQPWDSNTPEGIAGLTADIQAWLAVNGGGQVLDDPLSGLVVVFERCLDSQVFTMGTLVPSVQECDYIYELCDLYACISRLVNKWLCKDPCPVSDACSSNEDVLDYEEARKRAIELSTMFFHALMPLIQQDRLWHLGNWDVTNDRTCNVNNIIELFDKLRAYVHSCGFDCCNPCGDCGDCKGCDPCATDNYQSTSPNPCNCNG